MRYGIFSDIHGNIEALEAVISACREEGARALFCAGDVVGYGADPKACIALLKKFKVTTVAGNHDWAVVGKISTERFSDYGAKAIAWTQNNISSEDFAWLESLPITNKENNFTVVHASLHQPKQFPYLRDPIEAADSFYLMDCPLCFIGHTHVPQVYVKHGENINLSNKTVIDVDPLNKYIVNVGSVGQPRDNDPRAAYCIYDPDLHRISIKRVGYDIKRAQEKIWEAGLPDFLAQRLSIGQ